MGYLWARYALPGCRLFVGGNLGDLRFCTGPRPRGYLAIGVPIFLIVNIPLTEILVYSLKTLSLCGRL